MAQHDIGSLVVMDHGRMAGLVTFAEVLEALASAAARSATCASSAIAEATPLTATPGLNVMELRRMMLERHARYVPVMDGTTLLGVISFHDVAKAVYEEQSFENRMLKGYISDARPAPVSVNRGTEPAIFRVASDRTRLRSGSLRPIVYACSTNIAGRFA